jgi:hypothetical protein
MLPKIPSSERKAPAGPNGKTGKSDSEAFCYLSVGKSGMATPGFSQV